MTFWRTTILAIQLSIWPQKNGRKREYIVHTALADDSSFLRTIMADLTTNLDSDGQMKLFIPGCHAVAAPFMLFRLKREGFSECLAVHENGGLTIRARR